MQGLFDAQAGLTGGMICHHDSVSTQVDDTFWNHSPLRGNASSAWGMQCSPVSAELMGTMYILVLLITCLDVAAGCTFSS